MIFKMIPNRPKSTSRGNVFCFSMTVSFLHRFWLRFGSPNAFLLALCALRIDPKIDRYLSCKIKQPKMAPRRLKMAQEPSQDRPKIPRDRSERPSDSPRMPKSSQRPPQPQDRPNRPKMAHDHPKDIRNVVIPCVVLKLRELSVTRTCVLDID